MLLFVVMLLNGGCVGRMVGDLASAPFTVTRQIVVNTAKIPIDAAEMGARGVVKAVLK